MAGESRTTEAKVLESSRGEVDAVLGGDGDLGGEDAAPKDEAPRGELDRCERVAAGSVVDGAQ
jgi:hypothetical protein